MNQLCNLLRPIVGAAFIACMTTAGLAEATESKFTFAGRGTTGNIVFDDSVLDTSPDPAVGEYLGAIVHFYINIGGTPQSETGKPTYEIIEGSSGSIVVGLPGDALGQCGPIVCLTFLLGSNMFPPTDPLNFDLSFHYPTGSLATDALPVAVPATGVAILRSPTRQFFLGFDASSSIAPASIPEPPTWSLLGLSAALLALRRPRRN